MVTYGPWTQDPDFTTTVPYNDFGRYDRCTTTSVDPWHAIYGFYGYETGGPDYIHDGVFLSLQDTMADDPYGAPSDPPGTYGGNYLSRKSLLIGGSENTYRNEAVFQKCYWPQPVAFQDNYWAPSDYPDNAVGVEYQDHPEWGFAGKTSRVGAVLKAETEVRSTTGDGADPDFGQTYNFKIGFADMGRAQNGTYTSVDELEYLVGESHLVYQTDMNAQGSGTSSLGVDVDLTPYIRNLELGGALWTTNDGFIKSVPLEGDSEFATAYYQIWTYGSYLYKPVVAETFRPPVYRFILEDEPVIEGDFGNVRRRFVR